MTPLPSRDYSQAAPRGGSASVSSNTPRQAKATTRGRIRQSVCRGPFESLPLDVLCRAAADMGLKGIDLLMPEQWEIPRRYGLVCSMGDTGGPTIAEGTNRPENHPRIEAALRQNIARAAQLGVPNLITLSGNRHGMPDDQGARNSILFLRRVRPILEDHGVTLCLELLNSKITHPDYMCDHVAWGAAVVRAVDSPRVKLLYDIFHMQIMEGDVVRTIQTNIDVIGHFHTGGVPGRHELDNTQEVRWDGVMRGIVATEFSGYVAHEFEPTRDPLTSLREAVELCDV